MVYQGQVVHRFETQRDEQMFYDQANQILLFAKYLLVFLIGSALVAMIIQFNDLSAVDFAIFGFFILFIVFLYRTLLKRIARLDSPDLINKEESLVIYEYGIEFPPLANPDLQPGSVEELEAEHEFVTYNQITSIDISDDYIAIVTTEQNYVIDLVYFPFYSAEMDNYEEEVELLVDLLKLIRKNLAKVENRDHPTIIPKAYFRKILPV